MSLKLFRYFFAFALSCSCPVAAIAATVGVNGVRTISVAATAVNQITTLAAGIAAGANSFTVGSIAALSSTEAVGGGAPVLGSVLLIYQPRGASCTTTSNTSTYCLSFSIGNAGHYELVDVLSVSGNVVTICGSLKNSYDATNNTNGANTQVMRVPYYSTLNINSPGTVVPPSAWNGVSGGVVSFLAGTLTFSGGRVSADGRGLQGGIAINTDSSAGVNTIPQFATTTLSTDQGAIKGEGIGATGQTAGQWSNPGGGVVGLSAAINGGGGGADHNGGGGGGSNAAAPVYAAYCTPGKATALNSGLGALTWCGQGVMDTTNPNWATAWTLDPAYAANGNAVTNQGGGGRGGYTYTTNGTANPLTTVPGSTAWGGDFRRVLGGWGGQPLPQSPASVLFMGGGGGAGGQNNSTGSSGGAGGGVIIVQAGNITGSGGVISANGADAANCGAADACGGGGGGGSVALAVTGSTPGLSTISALGGAGGSQPSSSGENEGPGGGGGGGLLAITSGVSSSQFTAAGGSRGSSNTNNNANFANFLPNGATSGAGGLGTIIGLNSAPSCANLSIAKTNGVSTLLAGSTTAYAITVANAGPEAATGTVLKDPAAVGLSCTDVVCSASTPSGLCPAPAGVTITNLQTPGITLSNFPSSSTLTFTVTCGVTAIGQ